MKDKKDEDLSRASSPPVGDETSTDDGPENGQPERVEPEETELTVEEQLQKRVAELDDKLLRMAAEFDNYKKRTARQFDEMVRSANDRIIGEFLEIADNFERALNHAGEKTDAEAFRKGVELIFNQMKDLLQKYDITPIEALGQPFDPSLHDAMMQIESDEFADGIVAMEMSKGYRQGNRVVRHSKVAVSRGKNPENSEDNN